MFLGIAGCYVELKWLMVHINLRFFTTLLGGCNINLTFLREVQG